MFCCCFGQKVATKKFLQFEDHFEVVDRQLVVTRSPSLVADNGQNVKLYRDLTQIGEKEVPCYQIIFQRPMHYDFIVYHTGEMAEAQEYFQQLSAMFRNLDKSISANKSSAEVQLKAIMLCLKFNPRWTSTHVAAQIGLKTHFTGCKDIALAEINLQTDGTKYTPLHLAIIENHLAIVEAILDLKPCLDLVDAKQFSVLHFASLASYEIFCKILYQDGMFDRILWKNYQGSTALHLACFAQNFKNVFEFLRYGLTVQMLTLSPPKSVSKSSRTCDLSRRGSTRSKLSRQEEEEVMKNQMVVKFTDEDLGDIDCQDIAMGGSPLHWARNRRLLEKLIPYKFRLNIGNISGDTPLHLMIRRNRIRCVICLICAGADVNSKNHFGNTPLHLAVKSEEKVLIQTLAIFDADIDAVNNVGESARHLAARDNSSSVLLYLLSSIGAKRCDSKMNGCRSGCAFNGTFEGRCDPALLELTKHYENLFHDAKNARAFEMEMNENRSELEQRKCVNMLTIDGGGIKGLIVIQVLIEIQKYLDRPIIEYFDWVAGTSTGSFIATWLTTGKKLTEIRKIYFHLKDVIFVGERPYNSETLERYTRDTFGSDLKMEHLLTKYKKFVMIPATLFDRDPLTLHLFRSYESADELLGKPSGDPRFPTQPSRDQLVWKACRASGAAPTYFKAFGPFIDGGILANNPTIDALTDFEFRKNALLTLGRNAEVQKLKLVLSLGTGQQLSEAHEPVDISAVSFNFMEINNQIRYFCQMTTMLLHEICNTDNHLIDRAEAFCSAGNLLFFRINPLFNKLINLDESIDSKIVNILWETKRFMYHQRSEVGRIVDYLKKSTRYGFKSKPNP